MFILARGSIYELWRDEKLRVLILVPNGHCAEGLMVQRRRRLGFRGTVAIGTAEC